METLTRISDALDRVVTAIGRVCAWASVALMATIIFDVVTRRFLVLGSTRLQEFEWHLHTILFAFCLGFAYLADAHVRIDLVRERLSERTRHWIEVIGILVFLIPYSALIVWFGVDFVARSFGQGEASASATGLAYRWAIKAAIPAGFVLVLVAGIAVLMRKIVELFGPPPLAEEVEEIEHAERRTPIDVDPSELG